MYEKDEIAQSEIENEVFTVGIKTTLFGALSLEAGINDYGAWQLGDKYFETHLANLDVASKWVVIPKLICGKSIKKSGVAYSAMKQLIRARNGLVHNKSQNLDWSDPSLHLKLTKRDNEFVKNVHNAYRAIVLLSLEMDSLVGARYNPLMSFDKIINISLNTPVNIREVVNECRNIVSRNNS